MLRGHLDLHIILREIEHMVCEQKNVFERSGLAALSDFDSEDWRNIYSILEKDQNEFLAQEKYFRSPEYKWPRDPLHEWSRVWEYPYAYYNLLNYLKILPQDNRIVVADVGSGVTFFPFSLAKRCCHVVCTDIDSICGRDLSLAKNEVSHKPGNVSFRLIEDTKLPFNDFECDAVYCISVLEHIPLFENTIKEMARILKPGGLCIITCDINLKKSTGFQLDVNSHARLFSTIEKYFVQVFTDRTIHPNDMLTTINSPYAMIYSLNIIQIGWRIIKNKVLKPILRGKADKVRPDVPYLAVLGTVLRRK